MERKKRRPLSDETKKKITEALKERWKQKFTEEHKRNLIAKLIGRPVSDVTRKKISEALKGEKNYNWKGGISHLPYSVDWTKTLRQSIRERDSYMCKMCGEKQGDKALAVHHIDYDKNNCNPENLVTLCRSCHTKTNYKRKEWTHLFSRLAT